MAVETSESYAFEKDFESSFGMHLMCQTERELEGSAKAQKSDRQRTSEKDPMAV